MLDLPPRPPPPQAIQRVIAALLQSAAVAVSVGSIWATFGIVSGLTYASRLWLGTRRRAVELPRLGPAM